MENQRSPLLNWAYFCQGKTMEELRQTVLYTTLELETSRIQAHEEIKKRDDLLAHLKDLLTIAIKERDETEEKYQKLILENLIIQQENLQQQITPRSGISGIDDEPRREKVYNSSFSSSDCEESIVSSQIIDPIPQKLPSSSLGENLQFTKDESLPENGKFLEAVIKAGPLLQTLLLAGPLPQWKHPPPPLMSFEIPLVSIPAPPQQPVHHHSPISTSSRIMNRKRALCENPNPSQVNKYQRVLIHH